MGRMKKSNTKLKSPWRVDKSSIHKLGAIANSKIKKGEKITHPNFDIVNFNGYNHSCSPNCSFTQSHVLILRDIAKDEELTLFYIDCVGLVCRCPECNGRPIRKTLQGM